MDPSARSHRRAFWLIFGLVLTYAVGLVGYELNWLLQRRAAWDASRTWIGHHGADELEGPFAARGFGPLDKLAMWLSGEPKRAWFAVPTPARDSVVAALADGQFDDVLKHSDVAGLPDGILPEEIVESLEVVRRAHWLFPEAELTVGYRANEADAGTASEATAETTPAVP
jgi:hypothetical protein